MIVSAVSAVLVAIVGALSTIDIRARRRQLAKEERRHEIRSEESKLAMDMMAAAINLGLATAMAIEGQKLNGEMANAKINALRAHDEYTAFLKRIALRQVAK